MFSSFAMVVVFLPQIVLSSLQFQISQVRQCEPVSITLIGDPDTDPIPTTLTLIPFDYHLISVHLPNATANSSAVYVTFFPFPQGTSFVATIDDVNMTSAGVVSDIINVLPSPTGNTTCLPHGPRSPNIYTINSTVSQCQEFNVTYNTSVVSRGPSIRLFNPLGPSFLLNQTADNHEGTATYLMDFNQGEEVVLLFDGGTNNRKTSPLTIIGGNTLSSDNCLNNRLSVGSGSKSTSLALIVGSSVGGTIFLLFLCSTIFILRRRQKKNRQPLPFDRTALIEKGMISYHPPSPPLKENSTVSHHPRYDSDIPRAIHQRLASEQRFFVRNPPYTAEDFPYSPKSDSMMSWAQPAHVLASPRGRASESFNRRTSQGHLTLNSLDIEGMLNMATMQSSHSSTITVGVPAPVSAQPSSINTQSHPSPSGAGFTQLKPYPGRGRLPVPSDIPTHSSYSFTHSLHHTNPSADSNATGLSLTSRSIMRTSELDSTIRRPPDAVVALPSSPGHGQFGSRERHDAVTQSRLPASPSTRDSLGGWYGQHFV